MRCGFGLSCPCQVGRAASSDSLNSFGHINNETVRGLINTTMVFWFYFDFYMNWLHACPMKGAESPLAGGGPALGRV